MSRVLVVDDNRDTVDTTVEMLRAFGHQSRGCCMAVEALDCVTDFDPDIVLMDLAMPGMSGWEVARAIRQRFRGKRPVLVAISGEHTRTIDRMQSHMSGFDYYLVKPADPKVLMTLVDKAPQQHPQ